MEKKLFLNTAFGTLLTGWGTMTLTLFAVRMSATTSAAWLAWDAFWSAATLLITGYSARRTYIIYRGWRAIRLLKRRLPGMDWEKLNW
jgi:hypothetical protein